MPTSREIENAYRKLERAEHHINDLSRNIDAFLAERPFKVIAHYHRKAGKIAYRVKADKPIPPTFSLILGDAIHNLRSALDVMLYALAHERSAAPTNIQFPFPRRETDDALTGAIDSGQVKFAGEKVVEAIRRLDPRPSKNPMLSGIHALDIRDKHRLAILSRGIPNFSANALGVLLEKHTTVRLTGPGSLLMAAPDDKDILVIRRDFVLKHNSEEEAEVQPAFVITFGKGQPFENKIVLEILRNAGRAVRGALDDMLVAFLDVGNVFP
jgi:hypothetical protein